MPPTTIHQRLHVNTTFTFSCVPISHLHEQFPGPAYGILTAFTCFHHMGTMIMHIHGLFLLVPYHKLGMLNVSQQFPMYFTDTLTVKLCHQIYICILQMFRVPMIKAHGYILRQTGSGELHHIWTTFRGGVLGFLPPPPPRA